MTAQEQRSPERPYLFEHEFTSGRVPRTTVPIDNYIDLGKSPRSGTTSKMVASRYIRTLLGAGRRYSHLHGSAI